MTRMTRKRRLRTKMMKISRVRRMAAKRKRRTAFPVRLPAPFTSD